MLIGRNWVIKVGYRQAVIKPEKLLVFGGVIFNRNDTLLD